MNTGSLRLQKGALPARQARLQKKWKSLSYSVFPDFRNSTAFRKVNRHSWNDGKGKPEVQGEKPVALPQRAHYMNWSGN